MTEQSPEDVAVAASQPGVFNLIERLQNRNMPREEMSIFIDEGAAWERQRLEEELSTETDPEEVAALEAAIAAAVSRVKASEVVLVVQAISSKRYDELVEEARASFPRKFEKVTEPLTGQTSMKEVESPDRDELFNRLFVAECLIEARMGNDIDNNITTEWVVAFEGFAPLDAVRRLIEKVYKMRMVGEWMDEYQNEDFFPKP